MRGPRFESLLFRMSEKLLIFPNVHSVEDEVGRNCIFTRASNLMTPEAKPQRISGILDFWRNISVEAEIFNTINSNYVLLQSLLECLAFVWGTLQVVVAIVKTSFSILINTKLKLSSQRVHKVKIFFKNFLDLCDLKCLWWCF